MSQSSTDQEPKFWQYIEEIPPSSFITYLIYLETILSKWRDFLPLQHIEETTSHEDNSPKDI